jgi:hypothetical protein
VPEPRTRVVGTPDIAAKCAAQVRHDIDRVGDHHEHRVGRMLQHGRHHVAENGGVALEELEPRLARPLGDACGDDHRAAAGQVGVASGTHRQRVREGDRVKDVVRLRLGAFPIHVHQDELAADPAHHQRERGRRAQDAPA